MMSQVKRSWTTMGAIGLAGLVLAGGAGALLRPSAENPAAAIRTVAEPVQVSASQPTSPLSMPQLDQVSFVNPSLGYAAGGGQLFKTSDGGRSWTSIYHAKSAILGLDAVSADSVWAITKQSLIHSANGASFTAVDNQGAVAPSDPKTAWDAKTSVQFFANGTGIVEENHGVWRVSAGGGKWTSMGRAPNTDSVSFVSGARGYAVDNNVVYATRSGGQSWTKVFTAPVDIAQGEIWQSRLSTAGHSIGLLVYDGIAGMSQQGYVLFSSADDGAHWTALADESYWGPEGYPHVKPQSRVMAGLQPGPIQVFANGDVTMLGMGEGNLTEMTTLTPTGQVVVHDPVGPSANRPSSFDFPNHPLAMSAVDAKHIMVVGSHGNHGMWLSTASGGLTWMK